MAWGAVEAEGSCRPLNFNEAYAFGMNGAGAVLRFDNNDNPNIVVFQEPVPAPRENFGRRVIQPNEPVLVLLEPGHITINVGGRSREFVRSQVLLQTAGATVSSQPSSAR